MFVEKLFALNFLILRTDAKNSMAMNFALIFMKTVNGMMTGAIKLIVPVTFASSNQCKSVKVTAIISLMVLR